MKKFLLSFSLIFLFLVTVNAQDSTVTFVGPGTKLHHVFIPEGPWNINILEVDITNPYIKVESAVARDVLGGGLEKSSSMSARNDREGHRILGAVNGDYFGISAPTNPYTFLANSMVKDGEFVFGRTHKRSEFAMLENGKPLMEIFQFNGSVTTKMDSSFKIFGVNRERGADQLLLFNKYIGSSTKTNQYGTEIKIQIVDTFAVNDTLRFVAVEKQSSVGNMTIAGSYILSGNGKAGTFLNQNVNIGDTIKLFLGTKPKLGNVATLVGGGPRLIENGTIPADFVGVEGFGESHVNTQHPRTALGFSKDSTKLYLLTVDGRQPGLSAGMSCSQLAHYMSSIGCYNAYNLDGGGSTAMVVRNKIANSPSDPGGERSVGSCIMIASTAPTGPANVLHISPETIKIFTGKNVTYTVQATDEYENPVTLNLNQVQYSLSKEDLGSISADGLFTAGTVADSGYIYVTYNDLKDSAFVIVKTVDHIELSPKTAVTDNIRLVNFSTKVIDTDGQEQPVEAGLLSWACSDTTVGKIDVLGQFKGNETGTAKIIASYMGSKDTANITVQIGTGRTIIDSVESTSVWNLAGENVDSSNTFITFTEDTSTIGNSSLKLNYSFTYQTGKYNWAYLNTDIPIYGVPDSIFIDVLSDGQNHRVFLDVSDALGHFYRLNTNKLANNAGVFETLKGRIISSTGVIFPLKLQSISIPLGSGMQAGEVYSGSILFDNIRVSYPNEPTYVAAFQAPSTFRLFQNYPNPFNPSTRIAYQIPKTGFVSLKIYDILGNEITTLVNEEKSTGTYEVTFDANKLSSGVYFYQLRMGSYIAVKKLMLLK